MNKNILVVTSCTGEKIYKPGNQLTEKDFTNKDFLSSRTKELEAFQTTACEMYTGKQHLELMKGIQNFRKQGGKIDLAIISAGYGVLRENDVIVPYEVTFNSMSSKKIVAWSEQLEITQDFQELIKGYDLVFLLLGDKYLESINWKKIPIADNQKLIFFAGYSSKSRVLSKPGTYTLSIGENEAKHFKSGLIWIKGTLFANLLDASLQSAAAWEVIYEQPSIIRDEILRVSNTVQQLDWFSTNKDSEVLIPFSEYHPPFYVPDELVAKNYRTQLNFFIPENDDRVDPNFDFAVDYSNPKRNVFFEDVYAHEIYKTPQYDGVLISKVNIDLSKRKQGFLKEMSIHEFLRLPKHVPIMGDCGAFSYIGMEMPPYSTEEVLEYYQSLGYDYGVSVDHLIVGDFEKNEQERNRRYDITLRNARDFIEKHRQYNCTFTPIGVAQGWDPLSFKEAVESLIKMGYNHIALGGLARDKSETIFEILKAISPIIPDSSFRMHLFGVARDESIMKSFHKLGVTSFDSASPLRRAWLGSGHNYHTNVFDPEKGVYKHYTAIRIPEASESKGRVKKLLQENGGNFQEYKLREERALTALRQFDAGRLGVDETLQAILEYDQMLGEDREKHEEMYRKVLEEKPWKQCPCNICRDIGIDVIVFRGNNRNRRRGFHNTFVYYQQIDQMRKQLFE